MYGKLLDSMAGLYKVDSTCPVHAFNLYNREITDEAIDNGYLWIVEQLKRGMSFIKKKLALERTTFS